MKRVLLPVDGSECSLRAVSLVIEKRLLYVEPDELDVHLVNVQPILPLHMSMSSFSVPKEQIAEYQHWEGEKALETAQKQLDAAGVKYASHYLIGEAGDEIANLASSLKCDQIVMGTHGRSAIEDFLLGSVSLKVIQRSKVPVLLVK
ncbi:Nucleotide-binding universal stress protein, UspA family [Formivibrio citricus]|uniref:Nucleotide-binding universal stress protein, UspA family n=1 Tax=Formivibrio citricus TaxID=83765 RepID=A0A1I5E2W4_9NEIS|nr:universal stress protein [Formivibrio citricus]SFO05521.1 Nucleotide-binding universal stress protein, UspA family [Formivibrio citricus]